ncbi:MAG: RIP metalloprotease RseP [Candidatus Abyssubacteria bacterium]
MTHAAEVLAFLISVVRFIILIGVLIFVHELGHFIVAKLCNVYVARFSLGFGRKLFGFKRGETEYWVSAIPLGGYVKMVGQEDMPRTQEEVLQAEPEFANVPPERRFDTQPIRNKLAISFAGPLMNLLFAVPVLWVMLMMGVPVPIGAQHTFVGSVMKDSPAARSGIEPGQRILAIDGEPVNEWEEVQLRIWTNEDKPLSLKLERLYGGMFETTVIPARMENSSRAGIGIEPLNMVSIGEVFEGKPAERAGLKPGDIILTYNHEPPDSRSMSTGRLTEAIYESPGKPVVLTVLRNGHVEDVTVIPESVSAIEGVYFDGAVVAEVDKDEAGSVAEKLQPGDVVTAIEGKAVRATGVEALSAAIAEVEGEAVELTVKRERGPFQEPEIFDLEVPLRKKGMIGVLFTQFEMEKYRPGPALARSFEEFWGIVGLTLKTVYYLIAGRLSPKEMAGPIGIAVMSEQMLKILGVAHYLNLVAIITINLGILNLLPIPVLDGGQIFLTLVEKVRRKPLEEKYLILLQKIGIVFIIFLVLLATYNDILRVFRSIMGGEFFD